MYPNLKYAEEGTNVVFQCFSITPPLWYYETYNNIKIVNDTLVINNIKWLNHGRFKCEGRNRDNKRFFAIGYLKFISKNALFNYIY